MFDPDEVGASRSRTEDPPFLALSGLDQFRGSIATKDKEATHPPGDFPPIAVPGYGRSLHRAARSTR
jgi:hypothetical protein